MMPDWINPLVGWIGLGGTIIAAALAVAWFIPPLRNLAITVAAGVAGGLAVYGKGYRDAAEKKKREREADERKAIQRGRDARADAERDADSGVRDGFDRDNK